MFIHANIKQNNSIQTAYDSLEDVQSCPRAAKLTTGTCNIIDYKNPLYATDERFMTFIKFNVIQLMMLDS